MSSSNRLTLSELATAKRLPSSFLAALGLRDGPKGVEIPYYDATGRECIVRLRRSLNGDRFRWLEQGKKVIPYGRWRATQSHQLALVEGESDSWTLWFHGINALGIPGASCAGCLDANDLAGVERLLIVVEPGQSGQTFLRSVSQRLAQLGYRGRVVRLTMSDAGAKDVSDLHCQQNGQFMASWHRLTASGIAKSISTAEVQVEMEPLPLAPTRSVPPFPVEVLPDPLRQFVIAVADSTNCPVDFPAVFCLAALSVAIGRSVLIRIKQGWTEQANLFLALVAPAGSGKTPCWKAALGPILSEDSRRFAAWEAAKEEAADDQPIPPLQSLLVSDITVESLADVLSESRRGVLLSRDELTGLVASFNQYRGGRGADQQHYMELWAGVPIRVRRRTRSPIHVKSPFLTIVGGLPPSCLHLLRADANMANGWLSRWLFAYPEPTPLVGENWRLLDPDIVATWEEVIAQLLQLDGQAVATLDSGGRAAWQQVTTVMADMANSADAQDYERDVLQKYRAYLARLALLLEVSSSPGYVPHAISGQAIQNAWKLVQYFLEHFHAVVASLESNSSLQQAKRVVELLQRRGMTEFRPWELARAMSGGRRAVHVDDLESTLSLLERMGWITPAPDSGCRPGGKMARLYQLVPNAAHSLTHASESSESSES